MGLQREALIDVAMGYEPADKVIKNCRIVNSHTGTIHQPSDSVAIKGQRIAAIGDVPREMDRLLRMKQNFTYKKNPEEADNKLPFAVE